MPDIADPDIFLGREEESLFARDDNDVLVRREKETRDRFRDLVTVVIDGFPVEVPRAVPKTDAQGNVVRDADGKEIPRTTTIYDAAAALVAAGAWTEEELKERIPVLCHQRHVAPVAVCRMCSVHISSMKRGKLTPGRKLVPACQHRVETNMVVTTRAGLDGYNPQKREETKSDEKTAKTIRDAADSVNQSVKLLAEFLVADCLHEPLTETKRYEDELSTVARSLEVLEARPSLRKPAALPSRNAAEDAIPKSRRVNLPLLPTLRENELAEEAPELRDAWEEWNAQIDKDYPYSSRTVVVDHDRCIVCDRCVRACSEVKPFKVIGHTGKGYGTRISFDLDSVMRDSTCVQCGECMNSCPTGALSLRRRVRPRAWGDDSPEQVPVNPNTPFPEGSDFLTADQMRDVWLLYESPTRGARVVFPFRSIPYSYLKWNEGAVRRWEIRPGDRKVLCDEGEYGSTAFLLQGTGTFEIYVRGPEPEVRLGLLGSLFGGAKKKKKRAAGDYGALVKVSSGDELVLGEMTCFTQRPRTATVVAVAEDDSPELTLGYDENGWPTVTRNPKKRGPVVVYEITRNMLDMMQRSASAREDIQEMYTLRAIQTGVQNSRVFEALDKMEREQAATFLLSEGVTFARVEAGEAIVSEGDVAAAFYIIRLGTVRVFTTAGGAEQVLRLLSAGDSFGERGLLSDRPGVRTATVAALDPVEVVRVPGPVFRRLCEKFPKLKEHMEEGPRRAVPGVAKDPPPAVLRDYVRQGLYQGQRLLVLDLKSCTRCDECTKACADSHDGNARLLREGLRFGDFLVATSCRSCQKPYCMEGCPVDAIHRRGAHLEVVIENHCIGCGLCERNCPYGAIHMTARGTPNPAATQHPSGDPLKIAARRAVNCDLCGGNEPFCVQACPHEAAYRMSGPGLLTEVLHRLETHD
ncbi:cyclic nucleotide-binding domain-containing protein [Gemmata sp. JC717]|uniref:cyclic nucleotide-binding domain-containing protein n=1 Tax=Gemmata algarum TaxID=2975278 RepID=UPI0021BB9CC2|nr:cyclic nucleotide-binding domain-containing protein [Gemmata algarum]MDY3551902.1 cyclic nucleotide-binding domain-containing protein [Gemmata algarum]